MPGRAGVAEIHGKTGCGFHGAPVGHFSSLVPGKRFPQVLGDTGGSVADRLGGLGSAVAVGQRGQKGVARDPFGEGRDCRAVTGADNQIAFPVTGFETLLDIGRTVTDGPDVTKRLTFCLLTAAAGLAPPPAAR